MEVGPGERESGGGPPHSTGWALGRRWEGLPWLRAQEWMGDSLVKPSEVVGAAVVQEEQQQE